MTVIFGEGFLLGLSTGAYCLASCLPVLAPYLLAGGGSWKGGLGAFIEFLGGRFAAYMLFAAAAALLGRLSGPYLPRGAVSAGMVLMSLLMFYSSILGSEKQRPACLAGPSAAWTEKRIPLILGFLTGINICPPFAAGLLRLIGLGDILKSLVFFCGFFFATSIFMLPALAPAPFSGPRLRRIGRMTLFLAALWYLFLGLGGIIA